MVLGFKFQLNTPYLHSWFQSSHHTWPKAQNKYPKKLEAGMAIPYVRIKWEKRKNLKRKITCTKAIIGSVQNLAITIEIKLDQNEWKVLVVAA